MKRDYQTVSENHAKEFFTHSLFLELNPQVHQYLEEHLMKTLSTKSSLLVAPNPNRRREFLKRRMSVKGAIKKTRTINVDCKYKLYEFLM